MLTRLLCSVALVALTAACVPPPEDIDTVPDFDPEETRMGRIQERGVLLVGIPDDPRPPFSFTPTGATTPEGFLIDLSNEIATGLDVDIEFLPLPVDQLLTLETGEGRSLDLSFPMVPTTENYVLEKCPREVEGDTVDVICRNVSHPFYVAHQRLLVRTGSGVAGIENLGGREVCSVANPGVGIDLTELNEAAEVIDATDPGECALLIENESVDVVTGLDFQLMQVWASSTDCAQPCPPSPDFSLIGDDLSTVGISAAMPPGGGWNGFVNATWAETDAEGRWLEFHENWIEPYGVELDAAPEMTVEEAAGLYPCDPDVPELACSKKGG